ncbi:restriction endonuclease subunit S [Mycoplasma sp. 2704]|uniref:restriction endonuclease subunit S n=1 Tax=unclassified Mycoplasma TaxID=2683645 RepID=UPI002B1E8D52|nr:restriction endonuclease subunit S [Mycoplasma sp. 2704]MEA4134492.1 restriction endonuclease subunit S [Mycoplasma sp. 2704]
MKLKDILTIKYGKNQNQVEVDYSDIPILGTGGLIGYASKPIYDHESVLIGRKGTISKPFYISKPFWTIDTLFYTEINDNIVLPKYLFYNLSTIDFSKYSEGAAVPSLTTKTLYELNIHIHSMIEQQHIVNIVRYY